MHRRLVEGERDVDIRVEHAVRVARIPVVVAVDRDAAHLAVVRVFVIERQEVLAEHEIAIAAFVVKLDNDLLEEGRVLDDFPRSTAGRAAAECQRVPVCIDDFVRFDTLRVGRHADKPIIDDIIGPALAGGRIFIGRIGDARYPRSHPGVRPVSRDIDPEHGHRRARGQDLLA